MSEPIQITDNTTQDEAIKLDWAEIFLVSGYYSCGEYE